RNFRRYLGVVGDELEVFQQGVVGRKAEAIGDHRHVSLGGDAMELDAAALALDDVEAVEHAHAIEMPPGAPELAIGDGLEARIFLHPNDVANGFIFDGAQFLRAHAAILAARLARCLDAVRTQKRADNIGPIGRLGYCHDYLLLKMKGLIRTEKVLATTILQNVYRWYSLFPEGQEDTKNGRAHFSDECVVCSGL